MRHLCFSIRHLLLIRGKQYLQKTRNNQIKVKLPLFNEQHFWHIEPPDCHRQEVDWNVCLLSSIRSLIHGPPCYSRILMRQFSCWTLASLDQKLRLFGFVISPKLLTFASQQLLLSWSANPHKAGEARSVHDGVTAGQMCTLPQMDWSWRTGTTLMGGWMKTRSIYLYPW